MLKLWYSPGACSLAPHILLYELGEPFEAIETPIGIGAHLTPEFTRINPKNRVPVLWVDGEVITELPAISAAISLRAPNLGLMGGTAMDRIRVIEWMNWLSGTLHGQGFASLWRPQRFANSEAAYESIRSQGRTAIAECFDMIDRRIRKNYSVGDGFTAVDAFLLVFHRWGNRVGMSMSSTYPRYTALVVSISERSSVQSALQAERICLIE